MVGMKKKELDTLKNLLLEEKKKIMRHLETLSDSAVEDLEVGSGDSVDIASLEINQANLQKIGKRETYLLKKIDLALAKFDDGTYGECESCGEQIAVARLMARPVAQLCIDCKTDQENTERKFSTREQEEEEEEGGAEESEEA
jgi:DnaK suppressor protein